MNKTYSLILPLAVAAGLVVGRASAGNLPTSAPVTIQIFGQDANGVIEDQNSDIFQIDADANGDFSSVDQFTPGEAGSDLWNVTSLTATGNIDPFVTLSFSATNTSATPTILTFVTTLPTGAVGPDTLLSGTVNGSVQDSNGDSSALLAPASTGAAIYEGIIDTGVALPLLVGASASVSAPAGSTVIGPDSASGLFGGPVSSTIGLTIEFLLSPGDSATFQASFVVTPVPEPTTGLLALTALLGAAGVRRRSA